MMHPALRHGWGLYCKALKKHPVLARSWISCVGLCVGDVLAQTAEKKKYSLERTVRFGAFGFLVHGPALHFFYKGLDKVVFPKQPFSPRAVVAKIGVDQFVWSPAFTCVFYACMKTLEGKPETTVSTIREKFWPTLTAGYAVWIPAHIVNYGLIPLHQRVLYVNVVNVFWNAILSRIAMAEKVEHQ